MAHRLRKRYGHMTRPVVRVTLRDAAGAILHAETRGAFNAGIRGSEAALRELGRAQNTVWTGDRPTREGDVYTRRWVSRDGRVVIARIEKE